MDKSQTFGLLVGAAIAFSVLVGYIATMKGRSMLGFTLLSMVLSPVVGFAVLMVMGDSPTVAENKAINAGELKPCPQCAEPVRAAARVCRHCGHGFAPAQAPESPLQEAA